MTTNINTVPAQIAGKFSLSAREVTLLNEISYLEENLKEYIAMTETKIIGYAKVISQEIEKTLKAKLDNVTIAFTDKEKEFLYEIFIKDLPAACIVMDGWKPVVVGEKSFETLKQLTTKYGFKDIRSLLKTINNSMEGLVKIEPEFSQTKDQYDFIFTLFE